MLATAVAGILGYAVQVLAPALLVDRGTYIAFSVLWSAVYLCGSAMSGVQQEISRAVHPALERIVDSPLRSFTWGAGIVAVLIGLLTGAGLALSVVPGDLMALSGAVGIALVGYLITTVLTGVLYGLALWRQVAALVILDATLRAAALTLAFAFQMPIEVLALVISFPFVLAPAAVWLIVRSRITGGHILDVSFMELVGNILRTVAAAACMGAMISGLPLLIGLTKGSSAEAVLGAVILAITLTRAPIVVPVIALQSFLISAIFRGRPHPAPRIVVRLLLLALVGIVVLAGLASLIGPWIIQLVSAGRFEVSPGMMAIIVLSGGLVAIMCISGPALIAARRHTANLIGWAVAAALTMLCLLFPLEILLKVSIAIVVPAIAGISVHLVSLLRRTGTA
ncbi:Possible membrane protein [Microbacterium esteraromaticum]|uniref:Possible membrane protein n=1 Tax=Microbacterium esteraromaticum TaxID=57043 RepID=A0A1R4JEL6_9MICO|nr:Possible membrane protein [Microbacterium esteraromaticum]